MSEILKSIVSKKVERLIQLAVLATNQYAVSRGDWEFKPQTDEKAAEFEKNVNDPEHKLFRRFDLTDIFEGIYALEGKEFPRIRSTYDIPSVSFGYGVVVVPTLPVLGEVPAEYTDKVENGYTVGQPYFLVSTWKEKTEAKNPPRRGRGASNALAQLGEIPFCPERLDLVRPATDAEITAVINSLVILRGVTFVEDVLKNLEATYASLLA